MIGSRSVIEGWTFFLTLLLLIVHFDGHAEQTGSITGVVVDQSEAVIANAQVTLVGAGATDRIATRTDDSGRFRLRIPVSSSYDLVVSSAGFEDAQLHGVSAMEGEDTPILHIILKVKSVFPNDCGDFLATPFVAFETVSPGRAEVTGTVVESANIGLSEVVVFLTSLDPGSKPTATRTDAQGRFCFLVQRPGTYSLVAHAEGYADFIVDKVAVKNGYRSHVVDEFKLYRCPRGTECAPTKKVHTSAICL